MKKMLMFACSALMLPVLAGNVCTWTGNGGDAKWSTSANWDVAPTSGNNDILVFSSADALATENDTADFSVGGLVFSGAGAKTLSGQTVVLAGSYIKAANNGGTANARSYAISNASPTTIVAPLSCTGNAQFLNAFAGNGNDATPIDFNGAISIAEGKKLTVGDAFAFNRDSGSNKRPYRFNGAINAPKGTLVFSNWSKSSVLLNAAVDVGSLEFYWSGGSGVYLPAFSRSVRIRNSSLSLWYALLHFRADDTFLEDGCALTWGDDWYEQRFPPIGLTAMRRLLLI